MRATPVSPGRWQRPTGAGSSEAAGDTAAPSAPDGVVASAARLQPGGETPEGWGVWVGEGRTGLGQDWAGPTGQISRFQEAVPLPWACPLRPRTVGDRAPAGRAAWGSRETRSSGCFSCSWPPARGSSSLCSPRRGSRTRGPGPEPGRGCLKRPNREGPGDGQSAQPRALGLPSVPDSLGRLWLRPSAL